MATVVEVPAKIGENGTDGPVYGCKSELFNSPRMTKEFIRKHCKEHKLYNTPSLNDVLYLHFKGFSYIENLDEYTGLKCLWLENNGIRQISGLDNQAQLRSLFLHFNLIKKIENLESCCPALDNLNLANNQVRKIENLAGIKHLHTLNLAHNYVETLEHFEHLVDMHELSVLDLSNNHIDDPLIVEVVGKMPDLRVLSLMGNPAIRRIPAYRKTLILACKQLQYLDDRPVFPRDRACAEAWQRGGMAEENAERLRWIERERRKITDSVDALIAMRDRRRLQNRQTITSDSGIGTSGAESESEATANHSSEENEEEEIEEAAAAAAAEPPPLEVLEIAGSDNEEMEENVQEEQNSENDVDNEGFMEDRQIPAEEYSEYRDRIFDFDRRVAKQRKLNLVEEIQMEEIQEAAPETVEESRKKKMAYKLDVDELQQALKDEIKIGKLVATEENDEKETEESEANAGNELAEKKVCEEAMDEGKEDSEALLTALRNWEQRNDEEKHEQLAEKKVCEERLDGGKEDSGALFTALKNWEQCNDNNEKLAEEVCDEATDEGKEKSGALSTVLKNWEQCNEEEKHEEMFDREDLLQSMFSGDTEMKEPERKNIQLIETMPAEKKLIEELPLRPEETVEDISVNQEKLTDEAKLQLGGKKRTTSGLLQQAEEAWSKVMEEFSRCEEETNIEAIRLIASLKKIKEEINDESSDEDILIKPCDSDDLEVIQLNDMIQLEDERKLLKEKNQSETACKEMNDGEHEERDEEDPASEVEAQEDEGDETVQETQDEATGMSFGSDEIVIRGTPEASEALADPSSIFEMEAVPYYERLDHSERTEFDNLLHYNENNHNFMVRLEAGEVLKVEDLPKPLYPENLEDEAKLEYRDLFNWELKIPEENKMILLPIQRKRLIVDENEDELTELRAYMRMDKEQARAPKEQDSEDQDAGKNAALMKESISDLRREMARFCQNLKQFAEKTKTTREEILRDVDESLLRASEKLEGARDQNRGDFKGEKRTKAEESEAQENEGGNEEEMTGVDENFKGGKDDSDDEENLPVVRRDVNCTLEMQMANEM